MTRKQSTSHQVSASSRTPRFRKLHVEPLEDRRLLAVFAVDNLNDSGTGSLRDAIEQANAAEGPDQIEFGIGASQGTIALTSGELEITDTLTITGPPIQGLLVIDAEQNSRVLNFSALSGDLTLNALTITGGLTTGNNFYPGNQTGYDPAYNGGGIRFLSTGTLTLNGTTVTGNATAGLGASGGGIASREGNIVLTGSSTVSGNTTSGIWGRGGGIYSQSGDVTVTGSTITGNSTSASGGSGGGVFTLSGIVSLSSSALSDNHTLFTGPLNAGRFNNGGGISTLSGGVTVASSTVDGNSTRGDSSPGGAIVASDGTVQVESSIFSNNYTAGDNSKGGAIQAGSGPTQPGAIVVSGESTFEGNYTLGVGSGGGVLASFYGVISVDNSTFLGNHTAGMFAAGGAIYQDSGTVAVTNDSLLSGNYTQGSQSAGGAVYTDDGEISLTNSTITTNHTEGSQSGGGGLFARRNGGAVTVVGSVLSDNRVEGISGGGAIGGDLDTTISIATSTISGNITQGRGGGIYGRGDVTITATTIDGNVAGIGGGGVWNGYESLTITYSTISNNRTTSATSGRGGGINALDGPTVIDHTTISGNSTAASGPGGNGNGGGIVIELGTLLLSNTTITNNRTTGTGATGGGLSVTNSPAAVSVTIVNSIIARNSVAPGQRGDDFFTFDLTDSQYQVRNSLLGEVDELMALALLATDSLLGTPVSPIDPRLGPLADHRGPTMTHALLPGSPALDAGGVVPLLKQEYLLNGSLAEEFGGPDLVSLGGTLTAGDYDFGLNQGLEGEIPASHADNYTLEIRFQLDTVTASSGYQKLIDFSTPTHPKAGMYVFNNRLRYVIDDVVNFYTGTKVLQSDTWYVVTLSRDSGPDGQIGAYIDGVFDKAYPQTEPAGLHNIGLFTETDSSSDTRVLRLMRSENGFGEPAGGAVDYVRFYDKALTDDGSGGFDQRGAGFDRVVNGGNSQQIDIGAYESQDIPGYPLGDYNHDGIASAADYTVWRDTLGSTTDLRANGDNNGASAGQIDQADYVLWKANFGNTEIPLSSASPSAALSAAAVDAAFAMHQPPTNQPAGGRAAQVAEPTHGPVGDQALLLLLRRHATRGDSAEQVDAIASRDKALLQAVPATLEASVAAEFDESPLLTTRRRGARFW